MNAEECRFGNLAFGQQLFGQNKPPDGGFFIVYGRPIMMQELATAPTNEAGVLFLFGALAKKLGFMILRVQTEFPDIEALRCVGEKWKRVRIELEYESKNFLLHRHEPKGCELIVCWKHNWETCPVEVLELSMIVEK